MKKVNGEYIYMQRYYQKDKKVGNKNMAKILHLFRAEKFTEAYLKFITQNFMEDYHEFWIFGDGMLDYDRVDILRYKNAQYTKNIIKKLNAGKIYHFDKIIYHGVFHQNIIDFFAENRKLLDRLYLYFWGGDKFYFKNKSYIKRRFNHSKKKFVIRNAHGIINILPEEKKYMVKYYHPKGKFFLAVYPSDSIQKNLQRKREAKKNKDFVSILLGNSATETNHHISMLRKLTAFKDENIKIYVPLSYGSNSDYVQRVVGVGEKLFGEKFIAVTQFMKESEYYDFLNEMDIGIFDMNRQQALGNIFAMLFFGKKVYLRDHSVLRHYFAIRKHCIVYKTDEMDGMTFEDFVCFSREDAERNKEIVEQICFDKEQSIEEWKKIFDEKL